MQKLSLAAIITVMIVGIAMLAQNAIAIVNAPDEPAIFCKGELKYNWKWGVRRP
jgi:hypothetical protein